VQSKDLVVQSKDLDSVSFKMILFLSKAFLFLLKEGSPEGGSRLPAGLGSKLGRISREHSEIVAAPYRCTPVRKFPIDV